MIMLLLGLVEYLIILSTAYFPPSLIPDDLLYGYIDAMYNMEDFFVYAFSKKEK